MGVLVYRDQATASEAAATLIAAQVIEKPQSVLGLCAGNMMEGIYAKLSVMTGSGLLDWSDIIAFNLSEFVGMRSNQNRSLGGFMSHYLFDKINARRLNLHAPESCAVDLAAACTSYEDEIANAGGMDLLLVYIGRNGHLAYNEPARDFTSLTHASPLTESSIEENMAYFTAATEETPRVITMGVSTILSAKRIIAVAVGQNIAEVAARVISGPITPGLPASVLQLHNDVTFILDEAGAMRL